MSLKRQTARTVSSVNPVAPNDLPTVNAGLLMEFGAFFVGKKQRKNGFGVAGLCIRHAVEPIKPYCMKLEAKCVLY